MTQWTEQAYEDFKRKKFANTYNNKVNQQGFEAIVGIIRKLGMKEPGYYRIAVLLRHDKVPTRNGGWWYEGTVQRLCRIYANKLRLMGLEAFIPKGGGNKPKRKKNDPGIYRFE